MDLQEEIRKVAYELYEKSGRRGGRELKNWLEAERIVMARSAQEEKAARKVKTSAVAGKAPVRARVSQAAAQDKEPAAAGVRKPRTKKTGTKKAEKTAK